MTLKPLDPVIKWSGSKRLQAHIILPLISTKGRYVEPFVGGGSILGNIGPRQSLASDVMPELIELWRSIKDRPEYLETNYRQMWNQLQRDGHHVYYDIRDQFNKNRTPEHFLFLTRTCVNGLIRFNASGDFNNSLHHSRPGIHPDKMKEILKTWSYRVSKTNFLNCDYTEALSETRPHDTVYLDPPYMHNKGRYLRDTFDFDTLWTQLEDLNTRRVRWVLSIDGSSGSKNYSAGLATPRSLSKAEIRVPAGLSPFPRLQNSRHDVVVESIFTNFDIE